jgi:hypothetical protein
MVVVRLEEAGLLISDRSRKYSEMLTQREQKQGIVHF